MLIFIPGGKTPPALTVILIYTVIPLTMFFSALYLRLRYKIAFMCIQWHTFTRNLVLAILVPRLLEEL